MEQQQLVFESRSEEPEAASPPLRRPAVRDRAAFRSLLEDVVGRLRAESARADTGFPDAAARLGNAARNAQLIAARADRALQALPAPDLELLRAHRRLVAEIDEALKTRHALRLRAQPGGRRRRSA